VPSSLCPRPLRPRRARLAAAGALVALALPVAGCGGSSGGAGGSGDADPAAVVPASSAFYGEVTVRPEGDLKANVQALAKKLTNNPDPGARLVQLLDRSFSKGTTFKKDIDPWLGKKIGVAITGLTSASSPDYAIVLDATDTDLALKSLKKDAKNVVDRKYKDVGYLYNRDQQQAALTVKDTLTIGTEKAIRSVIDVEKGAPSLAKSDKLEKARKSVSTEGLGFFYVDPASLIDLASAASPALGSQAGSIKGLLGGANASALAATLTAQPDAIRLETAVDGTKAAKSSTEAADTVAGLPGGSVLALGLGDIGSSAQGGVAQVQKLGGIYASVLAQFRTITGLDLQQDVLSWMGKGGLFVRAKGITDIGGALVVDTSSEQKSTAFINSARRLLQQFGGGSGLQVSSFSGSGAKGFQVRIPQLPFPIIAATGSGKFVIAVGAASVAQALKPTSTLGDDPQFKATAARLGTRPAVYVDLKAIVGFAQLALNGDRSFQRALPYLEGLTALAAGSQTSGSTTKGTLVVGVK
jgi:hypothetical protein